MAMAGTSVLVYVSHFDTHITTTNEIMTDVLEASNEPEKNPNYPNYTLCSLQRDRLGLLSYIFIEFCKGTNVKRSF